jgi:ABC-type uncharacterized transport system ATPase subunit
VLSDAEVLCSRVAILANGRLMSVGRVSEMLAFKVRGWELVASRVTDALLAKLTSRARKVARLEDGRYAIDLPLDEAPEQVMADLARAGAALVSLNPIRYTLEDYFVEQVAGASMPEIDGVAGAARGART